MTYLSPAPRSTLFPGFELPTDPAEAARYELYIAGVHRRSCQGHYDDAVSEYDATIAGWRRVLRTARLLRNARRKWRVALARQQAARRSA